MEFRCARRGSHGNLSTPSARCSPSYLPLVLGGTIKPLALEWQAVHCGAWLLRGYKRTSNSTPPGTRARPRACARTPHERRRAPAALCVHSLCRCMRVSTACVRARACVRACLRACVRACVRACEHADVFGRGARSSCVRVARGPLAVHGVQKLVPNIDEGVNPRKTEPGKVKPWENIAIPEYPLMKLVRPPAVPRASLALSATARRSLALSARQVEAAFSFMAKQNAQVDSAKPPATILGAVLFECVEMYAPLPPLSTPYDVVLLA